MTYEEQLKAENEHLQEELRTALTSKHVAINKNEALRGDCDILRRENQSLRGDCDTLRRDCADIPYLHEQAEILGDNLAAMKSTNVHLMREIQSLRGDCDTLRRARDAAEKAVRRLESDNAFGIEQRNVAEAEVQRLWNENDALRKNLSGALQKEITDLRGDCLDLRRARDSAEAAVRRLESDNAFLTEQRNVAEAEVRRIADELRDLRQKLPTERVPTKQPPPGVQNLEVGLDTLRGWLARDRDLLAHATWCIASLVTNGDSAPAKDLLAARELMDEIRRTLTRRAGGDR